MKYGSRIVSLTGLLIMLQATVIHQPLDEVIKHAAVSIALLLSSIFLALGDLMAQNKKRDELAEAKEKEKFIRSLGH